MTADERIERLLNRFGQTISDLPKANDYKRNRKLIKTMISAENCADDWYNPHHDYGFYAYAYPAYICHLADVIDRMEIALETAANWMDCSACECGDFGSRECLIVKHNWDLEDDDPDYQKWCYGSFRIDDKLIDGTFGEEDKKC